MLQNKSITLVVPCKNEADSLPSLLASIPSFVDEVIVVDNNSSDATARVARSLGARVFTEKRTASGIGYGYAHMTGIAKAKGDIIVTMDGDGSYPVSALQPAIKHLLAQKLDFVSCNRFPLTDTSAISWIRQLGVWVLNAEVRILYSYPMQDILSGMWVVRRETARQLPLRCGGWNLSPEIKLAALMIPTVAFSEFHIDHEHRTGGASKQIIWKTGFGHLVYIAVARLTRFSGISELLKTQLSYFKPVAERVRAFTIL